MRFRVVALAFALFPAVVPLRPVAYQDVALKDLMPKGMAIGVAINQRQFEGTDTAAVDIITRQFNQISPENVLKFQPTQPAADRNTNCASQWGDVQRAHIDRSDCYRL